jgi:hypothetical protein
MSLREAEKITEKAALTLRRNHGKIRKRVAKAACQPGDHAERRRQTGKQTGTENGLVKPP